jgi:hypothetical protein
LEKKNESGPEQKFSLDYAEETGHKKDLSLFNYYYIKTNNGTHPPNRRKKDETRGIKKRRRRPNGESQKSEAGEKI